MAEVENVILTENQGPSLSQDQCAALQLLESDQNVFVTGEAGSGKSFLIRRYLQNKDTKKFPVLASTGAAAVLVGGRTFHSFMGLGIMEGGVEATIQRALMDKATVRRLNKIDGFILDEVSMLSGPTLQAAERICQVARGAELMAWGGLKVIVVGDFAQLPPVEHSTVKHWAFEDRVWERSRFEVAYLKQNMRSSDAEFLQILNFVRQGIVNDRVKNYLDQHLLDTDIDGDFEGTRLFPRRYQTDAYNEAQLALLDGELIEIPSQYWGAKHMVDRLRKITPLPECLRIKVGCLVMIRQNDPRGRWVNGSTGLVEQISDEEIWVQLLSGRTARIEKAEFSLMNSEGIPAATVSNFPLTLAYAATIHKAQGMTLDKALINIRQLWEPGQAYVALSRVQDPKHLKIEAWHPSAIRADGAVMKFYSHFL